MIDCFGILDDDKILKYFELGCEVKGLGRGHIARLKKLYRQNLGQEDKTFLESFATIASSVQI